MQVIRQVPIAVYAVLIAAIVVAAGIIISQQQAELHWAKAAPTHISRKPSADLSPDLVERPEVAIQQKPPVVRHAILPPVLSEADRQRYRAIFRAQKRGNWKEADSQVTLLENRLLLGHVQAQRLLHARYLADYEEVHGWLTYYNDHPQAERLHRLARKKRRSTAQVPPEVTGDFLRGYGSTLRPAREAQHTLLAAENWDGRPQAQRYWRKIQLLVGEGWVTRAYNLLQKQHRHFTALETDLARWRIAAGYYAYGKDEKAYRIARQAAQRSGDEVPELHWYAGLASWRLERPALAARHFAAMASHGEKLSPWHVSAAAYWAYRSYHRNRQKEKARAMLQLAARQSRTFYGMLAARTIDRPLKLQSSPLILTSGMLMMLRDEYPAIDRALALAEIDKPQEAEKELRRLFLQLPPEQRLQVLALSQRMNLPALTLRIAGGMARHGQFNDIALYPVPAWQIPSDNPALLLAVIRQESNFRNAVSSYRGAIGLMQLMPRTAWYIAKKAGLPFKQSRLTDPEYNMLIGSHYVDYLRKKRMVGNNLLYLLAAYNAGPGKLNIWKKSIAYRNDPLLFMESIPSPETRQYIEQVMANYWMYRLRLAGDLTSLDAVASGNWPHYGDSSFSVAALP